MINFVANYIQRTMEKQRAQSYEGGAGKEEAFQSLAIKATEMCTNDSIEMAF